MGKKITITYETLFDILRNEKSREELQHLGDDFLPCLVQYVHDKKQIAKKPDSELFSDIESQKANKQLENINRIVKEIFERREKKILNLAMIKSRSGSLLDESSLLSQEKDMLENITVVLDKARARLHQELLNSKPPKTTTQVRFIKQVGEFVGEELEVYGPYKEQETAELPISIAKVLIDKGDAQEI